MSDIPVSQIPLVSQSPLERISPEPASRVSSTFGKVMNAASSVASTVAETMMGIDPEYAALIQAQIQAQKELQVVSMISNVEKSKHETRMAAIRNVRVG